MRYTMNMDIPIRVSFNFMNQILGMIETVYILFDKKQ